MHFAAFEWHDAAEIRGAENLVVAGNAFVRPDAEVVFASARGLVEVIPYLPGFSVVGGFFQNPASRAGGWTHFDENESDVEDLGWCF